MMALMLGMTGMVAQNKVVVAGAGDVTLRPGEQTLINEGSVTRNDNTIHTTSYKDADITLQDLRSLTVAGAGDVTGKGVFKGDNLSITATGTGDVVLTIDYDSVSAIISGVGDVILKGNCHYLTATITGIGDLVTKDLQVDSLAVKSTRNGEYHWDWEWKKQDHPDSSPSKTEAPKAHKSLRFNPHWQGVDAGLNVLLGPGKNADWEGNYALLEQRPLRSWNFNFNIADIGLAFSYSRRAGIYTGVGLGWNNFSFNTPVRLEKGENKLVCHAIDESVEGRVKKSKLGVLYLQAPLMLEVKPTKKSYIALGVTGGFRIDTWTKIKYREGGKEKVHSDYYINRFKLDASLRAGGDNLGFYANYNLLPFFDESNAPTAHSISFGLSLNF